MIVVTGALGFISSCLISRLISEGYTEIIAVDDFSENKLQIKNNLENKSITKTINRLEFPSWLRENQICVDFIFHLGAKTQTTERSTEVLNKFNLQYSKEIFTICSENDIPIIYASSAATYGSGEFGYNDDESTIKNLKPLNPYGWSKQDFDLWVLEQEIKPTFWGGFKFFNVYGPNEYHKGQMASVVLSAYNQIKKNGKLNLFQSHKEGIENGHQRRDFIYVFDVIEVLMWFFNKRDHSGIYNLGSGNARTFLDLVKQVFKSMGIYENIDFIPTPEEIRDSYQYFTEAKMDKLRSIGYNRPFTSLEDGVDDYVTNYLKSNKIY